MLLPPYLNYLGTGLVSAVLLFAGYAAGYIRSSRKHSEQPSHHSNLLEDLPGAVIEIEAHSPWRIAAANQQAATILESTVPALKGTGLLSAALKPQDPQRKMEIEALLCRLASQVVDAEVTFRRSQSDGNPRWLECKAHPRRLSGASEVTSIYVLLQDVTEREIARQKYEVAQSIIQDSRDAIGASKIARDIGEHKAIETLRKDVAITEHLVAMRTAFLARMSHELRTPMTAVLGSSGMLMQSDLNDEQRSQVHAIQSSSRHLLRLLDDLLDTARLDKGALALEISPFSLHEMMSAIHAQFDAKAATKHIALDISCLPGTPEIFEGDAQRIQQIVGNLVDNAIKFTPKGKVQVVASYDGKALLLEVTDTGLGMSSEQLNQIFDPFVQTDGNLDRKYGGAGLGTTICKQLTHLMGGDVCVSSTPGQGSHFTVRLPLDVHAGESPATMSEIVPVKKKYLDEAAGLAIWGDMRDVWLEALQQFESELPNQMDRIRQSLQTNDCKLAAGSVHALRGAASTVALPRLFDRLDGMETMLRADLLVEAREVLPLLEEDASNTQREIRRRLKVTNQVKPATSAAEVIKGEALRELEAMRLQLEGSEIPAQTLKQLKRVLAGHQPDALWSKLCAALDAFEYESALTALDALESWIQALPAKRV